MNIGSISVQLLPQEPQSAICFAAKITTEALEQGAIDAFLPLLRRMVTPAEEAFPLQPDNQVPAASIPVQKNARKSTSPIPTATSKSQSRTEPVAPLTTPNRVTGIAESGAWENVPKIESPGDGSSQRLPTSQGGTGSYSSMELSAEGGSFSHDIVYATPRQPRLLEFQSEVSKPAFAFGLSISPKAANDATSASLEEMPLRPAAVVPHSAGVVEAVGLTGHSCAGDGWPEEPGPPQGIPDAGASLQHAPAMNQASAMVAPTSCAENPDTDASTDMSSATVGDPRDSRLLRKDDSSFPLTLDTASPADRAIPTALIPLKANSTAASDPADSRPRNETYSSTLERPMPGTPIASGCDFAMLPGEQERGSAAAMPRNEKSDPVEVYLKRGATEPNTRTAIHIPASAIRPPQSAETPAGSTSEASARDLPQGPLQDSSTAELQTKTAKVMTGNSQTPLAESGNPSNETPQVLTLAVAGTDGPPQVTQSVADPLRSATAEFDPPSETQNIASAQSTHQISFQLASPSVNNINVVFVEKAGKVEVAVRTPDAELARSLQSNLGDLVARLGESGLKSQVYLPANLHHFTAANLDFLSAGKNAGDPSSRNGSPGGQQDQQNGSNKRQQPRWRAQMEETLSGEEARSDIQ